MITEMFSSGPNYGKLKTNLRLAMNRLKLLEKKKTELAQKERKEIADYITTGKVPFHIWGNLKVVFIDLPMHRHELIASRA